MSTGILPNVNLLRTNRDVRQGISVCSGSIRLTNNRTKSRKKSDLSPKKKRTRRQKCSGYCENCISDGLCVTRLGVIGFSKRQTSQGKPGAKSLADGSKNTIHSVYATSSKYPGKNHSLEKYKSKILISPRAVKFEDGSHEETERQERCARSKAWDLAKNI